jgi:hypothetical protein
MRLALLPAAVLGLAMATGAAMAFPAQRIQPCDEHPPAWALQPVSGPVWIYEVPADEMTARCNKAPGVVMYGCTFRATAAHPAIVFLNALLTPAERECTLTYEKAHLPPNNWLDPTTEARATDLPGITSPAALPGMIHSPHE